MTLKATDNQYGRLSYRGLGFLVFCVVRTAESVKRNKFSLFGDASRTNRKPQPVNFCSVCSQEFTLRDQYVWSL